MVRIPHWWRQMKRREIEFSAQSAKSGGVGKVQSQTCISFQMQGMNRLVEKYESEIFLFCFSTQNKDRSSESKFSFKIFQKKSFQVFPYIKFVCHQTKQFQQKKARQGPKFARKQVVIISLVSKLLPPFRNVTFSEYTANRNV